MNNDDRILLFTAIGQILSNQDKLFKHLGINNKNSDYGYDDAETEHLSNMCFVAARCYEE